MNLNQELNFVRLVCLCAFQLCTICIQICVPNPPQSFLFVNAFPPFPSYCPFFVIVNIIITDIQIFLVYTVKSIRCHSSCRNYKNKYYLMILYFKSNSSLSHCVCMKRQLYFKVPSSLPHIDNFILQICISDGHVQFQLH